MRKFLYKSIVEKLKEIKDSDDNAVIKHFDVWNNNLVYIQENEPFQCPAVFVEFGRIEWRHQGGGVREAAVEIILHVVTQRNAPTSHELTYEDLSLQFFDLLTQINVCLHGHSKTEYNFGQDDLTSTYSITDHNFEELRHDIEGFSCHVCDASAMPEPPTAGVPMVDLRL
jgi:hypothetical protein